MCYYISVYKCACTLSFWKTLLGKLKHLNLILINNCIQYLTCTMKVSQYQYNLFNIEWITIFSGFNNSSRQFHAPYIIQKYQYRNEATNTATSCLFCLRTSANAVASRADMYHVYAVSLYIIYRLQLTQYMYLRPTYRRLCGGGRQGI